MAIRRTEAEGNPRSADGMWLDAQAPHHFIWEPLANLIATALEHCLHALSGYRFGALDVACHDFK